MKNEKHSDFCKELGNSNYSLSNRTIENQNEFFQRKLGISRESAVNMEEDKFHDLIENRSGRKLGYDENIKIDGCALVTLEELEEKEER